MHSYNGAIQAHSLNGAKHAHSYNGAIQAHSLNGAKHVHSYNGTIHAHSYNETIHAHSHNGAIYAHSYGNGAMPNLNHHHGGPSISRMTEDRLHRKTCAGGCLKW